MAIWYTDIASLQQLGINFPGQVSQQQLTNLPGGQNNPIFENDTEIIGSYTWIGTEAVGDTIYVGLANAGMVIDPNGHVSSGVTGPCHDPNGRGRG